MPEYGFERGPKDKDTKDMEEKWNVTDEDTESKGNPSKWEPSDEEIKNEAYNTLNFINDLMREMTKLVASEYINPNTKIIQRTKASTLLERDRGYISNIISKLTNQNHRNYNPDYKLSKRKLRDLKNSLLNLYEARADDCIQVIKNYKERNNLKDYYKQNEKLNHKIFKVIDTPEKAYWFGFLMDGYVSQKYGVELDLGYKDKEHLKKYCEFLGLSPEKHVDICERYDKRTKKSYKKARVRFRSQKIVDDILSKGFGGSHSIDKDLPDFINNIENARDNPIALAWLYGIYDADGREGETCIYAKDRNFLEKIKEKFSIKNEVKESDVDYWYIFMGSRLANKAMSTYEKGLDRKKKRFDESKERKEIVIENLKANGMTEEKFQELTNYFTRDEFRTIFGISYKIFNQLETDWAITFPSRGYWSSKEGLERKINRKKELERMGLGALLDKL